MTSWIVLVPATPGLTYPPAAVLSGSTTAVSNTLPGGSAVAIGLTYGMLASWGFSRSRSTISVIVSGIWNNFAKLGFPVVGLVLLALRGDADAVREGEDGLRMGAAAAVVGRDGRRPRRRPAAARQSALGMGVPCGSLSTVMSLSRTCLRAHWLSDVVAGGLLGTSIAVGWPAVLQEGRAQVARRRRGRIGEAAT